MSNTIEYKGLTITNPDPTKDGGSLIQNNFKTIADWNETTSAINAVFPTLLSITGDGSDLYIRPKGLWRTIQKMTDTYTGIASHKFVILGDSVGGFKPMWMIPFISTAMGAPYGGGVDGTFQQAFGASKGLFVTPVTNTGSPLFESDKFQYWITGDILTMSSGDSCWFSWSGVDPTWTNSTLYYIKEPGAGTITVNINGVDQTVIDCNSATTELGIVKYNQAQLSTRIIATCSTGTVHIVGVICEDNTYSGVITANVSKGGLSLQDAMSSSQCRNIFKQFLSDFDPDLISMEMKENSSYYETSLRLMADAISSANITSDILAIASTPYADVNNNNDQIVQNYQLKQVAKDYNWTFWDGYSPCISYNHLLKLGWQGDGTHVNQKCSRYLTTLLMNDMGLSSPIASSYMPLACNSPQIASNLGYGTIIGTAANGIRLDGDRVYKLDYYIYSTRSLSLNPAGTEAFKVQSDGYGCGMQKMLFYRYTINTPGPSLPSQVDLGYSPAMAWVNDASGGGVPVYTRGDGVWRRFDTNEAVV